MWCYILCLNTHTVFEARGLQRKDAAVLDVYVKVRVTIFSVALPTLPPVFPLSFSPYLFFPPSSSLPLLPSLLSFPPSFPSLSSLLPSSPLTPSPSLLSSSPFPSSLSLPSLFYLPSLPLSLAVHLTWSPEVYQKENKDPQRPRSSLQSEVHIVRSTLTVLFNIHTLAKLTTCVFFLSSLLSESDAEKKLFISMWTPHFPSRYV